LPSAEVAVCMMESEIQAVYLEILLIRIKKNFGTVPQKIFSTAVNIYDVILSWCWDLLGLETNCMLNF
jgi:hypothetical protein